jgi:hypothetical protein
MKKFLTILGIFGSLTVAQAQSYVAELAGNQEVPPNSSPGYGDADFTLSGTTLSVNLGTGSYTDLLGNSSAVTINDASPNGYGYNGPVIFALSLNSPGSTSGTFNGSGTLTTQQILDLNAGDLYVNLRSNVYPSGEIRGELEAVPEPSALALIGTGALALLARRRGKI